MSSYAEAGVDIDAANQAKRLITDAVRSTHSTAVLAGMGAFGGAFDLSDIVARYPHPVLVASTDGVGTKTIIAREVGSYRSIGQDLVNHCINDILVQGARPLFFMDYIAAARLDPQHIADVVGGVADACRAAGCALLGGETAEMPGVYVTGAFDVAGTIVGVVDRDRLINGSSIQPGDVVVGLRSNGLHTNGYSLARRICDPLGYATRPDDLDGVSLGEALLAVHRSYLPELDALLQSGVTVKGMAHITGGGLLENVPRTLPEGTGVRLERGSWPVPPILRLLVSRAEMEETEALRVFNMGVGMVVIVAPDQLAQVRELLPESDLIGEVVAGQGVTIA